MLSQTLLGLVQVQVDVKALVLARAACVCKRMARAASVHGRSFLYSVCLARVLLRWKIVETWKYLSIGWF
eukprot:1161371-Pelagomonas_calceolata.AAC.13